ncbi:putative reverse transcriptase domain-containing protein [Tanacetum coccineum]
MRPVPPSPDHTPALYVYPPNSGDDSSDEDLSDTAKSLHTQSTSTSVVHPSPTQSLPTGLVLANQPEKEIPILLGYNVAMNRWRATPSSTGIHYFHQSYHPLTKTRMARESMNQIKQQEEKIAEDTSNKRKWEGDDKGSSSQKQNKEPKVIRAHTTGPSNKEGYAGNLPLLAKQKVEVTCYECGMLRHYKSKCPKWKFQKPVNKYWKEKALRDSSVVANNVDV